MNFNKSILLLIAFALLDLVSASPIFNSPKHKKNIIFMVPDGCSPSAMNLARQYKIHRDGLSNDTNLNIDPFIIGTVETSSYSSLITDSAAAGTAFATGIKTYNGAIGVDPEEKPKGTIMEALKQMGYTTGLVVTTKITDATPAVFAAHVNSRSLENEIAEQYFTPMIGDRTVDLLIGGGKCHFIPQTEEGSCREDDTNLISKAKENGWTYVDQKEEFLSLDYSSTSLPFMGFFADEKMAYEIDRDDTKEPSLAEMTTFALNLLAEQTKDKDQGFFIMIEGSRVDHTSHDNDAGAVGPEILAYDEAWKAATEFVDNSRDDTIIVSVADHETGGIALAYDDQPSWLPEVLLTKNHSSEWFNKQLTALNATDADNATITSSILEFFAKEMNITDVEEQESSKILNELRSADGDLTHAISKVTSDRAVIGYTTGGHSNAYVNVYAYTNSKHFSNEILKTGKNDGLAGYHDNTDVPKFFAKLAGADMDAITEKLNQALD